MVAERPQFVNEASLAYNTRLDVAAYRQLLSQKSHLGEEQFSQDLIRLNHLVRHNLETALGERFNTEMFCESYFVEDNQIYRHSFTSPFLEVIKKGQQFRQEKGSREVGRELAEIEGFAKVQELLANTSEVSSGSSEV